jgi:hypothetical protein
VLFHPDQSNPRYTDVDQDVWMAVTDWTADRTIKDGYSDRFYQAQLTVLADEEFVHADGGVHRSSLLNLGSKWSAPDYSAAIRAAYNAGDIVRIPS